VNSKVDGCLDLDAPQDVGLIVTMLREQVIALCAQSSRKPSLVRLSAGDVSVKVEWRDNAPSVLPSAVTAASPSVSVHSATHPESATAPQSTADEHLVCAHMVGVFYRAMEPGAKPLVAEGDLILPGQQVGIIEAMKLMTPVDVEHAGRVVKILVADGASVEHGQPLMVLEPRS
jgi:acetyl-CoA carboxylase biotin carboxyl carrier protein